MIIKTIDYPDKVKLTLRRSKYEVTQTLPVRTLKKLCFPGSWNLETLPGPEIAGERCRLDFSAPVGDFLKIFKKDDANLGFIGNDKYHRSTFSRLEPARDYIFRNFNEAKFFRDRFAKKVCMKNSNYFEFHKGETIYLNRRIETKKFVFTGYVDESKITGEPCFHTEFRIKTPSLIEKHTGIRSIRDLYVNYDGSSVNFLYDELFDGNIYFATFDYLKLGKRLLNCSREKNLSRRKKKLALRKGKRFVNNISVFFVSLFKTRFIDRRKEILNDKLIKNDQKWVNANANNFLKEYDFWSQF